MNGDTRTRKPSSIAAPARRPADYQQLPVDSSQPVDPSPREHTCVRVHNAIHKRFGAWEGVMVSSYTPVFNAFASFCSIHHYKVYRYIYIQNRYRPHRLSAKPEQPKKICNNRKKYERLNRSQKPGQTRVICVRKTVGVITNVTKGRGT